MYVCEISNVTLISPIVNPPVTTIGIVAMLFAVFAIIASVKSVAVNVFPQTTFPVLKLLIVAGGAKAVPHLLVATTLQ